MRVTGVFAGLAIMATAAVAAAQDGLSIKRALYIERVNQDGKSLEPADELRPGDKVVLVMQWQEAESGSFVLHSRVPATLAFQRSSSLAVEVSIDGGKRWGRIGSLRKGDRLAAPEEVTNLRWTIAANEARAMRSYSAIVR